MIMKTIGVCGACGQSSIPVVFYRRTKEWLCDKCLRDKKLEPQTKKHIKKNEKEKADWDYLTS